MIERDVDRRRAIAVHVVVEHGRQEIVGALDGEQIVAQTEQALVERRDDRLAATGATTFAAEGRAERRLAQTRGRPMAQRGQAHRQTDRRHRLAFTRRSRRHRTHEDVL